MYLLVIISKIRVRGVKIKIEQKKIKLGNNKLDNVGVN